MSAEARPTSTNVRAIHPPPHHLDVEAALLAVLMLGEATPVDLTPLRAEHFYQPAHRYLFEAVVAIVAEGATPDQVTVTGKLREMERLTDVGGSPAIGRILDEVPSIPDLPAAVRLVVDAWARREVGAKAQRWLTAARRQGSDTAQFLATIRKEVEALEEARSQSDAATDMLSGFKADFQTIHDAANAQPKTVSTGYPSMDRAMDGGLWEGKTVVIGARSGCGKTAVGINLALRCAETPPEDGGGGVLFVSAELPASEIRQRFVCHEALVSMADYRSGRSMAHVTQWVSHLAQQPIHVDEQSRTIEAVRASVRRHKRLLESRGQRLRLVVVDYFQELTTLATHDRLIDRLKAVSDGFRQMRAELPEATLVVLAQLNRDGAKGARRPILSDIADCDEIGRSADTVAMLWQPDPDKAPDDVEMVFPKNRGLHQHIRPVFQRNQPCGVLTEKEVQS